MSALTVARALRDGRLSMAEAAPLFAASDEFADGTWRDTDGSNLLVATARIVGGNTAGRLWVAAERIFEARDLAAGQRGLPLASTPRPRWFLRAAGRLTGLRLVGRRPC